MHYILLTDFCCWFLLKKNSHFILPHLFKTNSIGCEIASVTFVHESLNILKRLKGYLTLQGWFQLLEDLIIDYIFKCHIIELVKQCWSVNDYHLQILETFIFDWFFFDICLWHSCFSTNKTEGGCLKCQCFSVPQN